VLEAALLSASEFDLRQRAQQGNAGAKNMLELKQHRLEESISAILTYNTIAHTVGATLSGYFAAKAFGDDMVGIFSAILTILILVVTEIIPKTLGTVHALKLASFVNRTIRLMLLPPMSWLLYMLQFITRLIAPKGVSHRQMTRRDIIAVVQGAMQDKALDDDESRTLINVLKISEVKLEDIMTPRTVTVMLRDDLTLAEALEQDDVEVFSRIPIYHETRDNVLGYILITEVLWDLAEGEKPRTTPIAEFIRPIITMDEEITVAEALRRFEREGEHLAIVTDDHGGTAGLVTMEDVIETALGFEIVDELDNHADLRMEAIRLRDLRLKRLEQARERNGARRLERRSAPTATANITP